MSKCCIIDRKARGGQFNGFLSVLENACFEIITISESGQQWHSFNSFSPPPARHYIPTKKNQRQPFTFKQFTFVCTRHRAQSCEWSGLTMKYHFLIFPSPPPEDTEQAILRAVTEKLISTISRWTKQGESPVTGAGIYTSNKRLVIIKN